MIAYKTLSLYINYLLISIYNLLISVFLFFITAFIVKLLKNSLLLNGIINYIAHGYIFAIPSKKKIILQFKF